MSLTIERKEYPQKNIEQDTRGHTKKKQKGTRDNKHKTKKKEKKNTRGAFFFFPLFFSFRPPGTMAAC
jgi:hypothetical protein